MQLFRFILASLLALVLVLIPTLSYANSATAKLPAGFQMPAVGDVAKRVVSRSNAVSYAVKGLLGAVTWVLDTKNNRVTFHGKPIGVFSVRDGSIGSISSLQDHACTKAYYGEGRNYKETHLDKWFAGSLYIKCNNGWAVLEPLKENGSVSYEQIATEIIKNAKAGHADSVNFVKSVAADIAKQDEAEPKPAPKPIASTNANEDTDTSNPDKEKDEAEEKPKTDKPIKTGNPDIDDIFKDAYQKSGGEKDYQYPGTREELERDLKNANPEKYEEEIRDDGSKVTKTKFSDGFRVNIYPGRKSKDFKETGWEIRKPNGNDIYKGTTK